MINERKALFRQLQHYFDTSLFGVYRWSDVRRRAPEPVTIEREARGRRINQRSFGKFVERVVCEFDGYTLIVNSPNEIERPPGDEKSEPPAVELYDGEPQPDNLVVQGANRKETWDRITTLLRDNMKEGKSNGGPQRGAGW